MTSLPTNTIPKIVGYGICGPNEPYLEQTLKEFKRLCDDVIICTNNTSAEGIALIKEYGFRSVSDHREWGRFQWKIKEDFVKKHVAPLKPDLCVCLDMDEVFDKNLTKEKLIELYQQPVEAFYFWIVNLWDDGYCRERNFWNIRAWKWVKSNGLEWKRSPLHCGLAPEWTYFYGYYSPYILKHYGLKDKERREQKARRYDQYDPSAKYISKEYYSSLRSNVHTLPFDEDALHEEVTKYVKDIKQKITKRNMQQREYVYIKTLRGETAAVPKNKIQDYLKQGCTYVGEVQELENTLDEILKEDDAPAPVEPSITIREVEEQDAVFKCGQCNKDFDSQKGLRGHQMGAHQNQHIQNAVEKVKRWSWN